MQENAINTAQTVAHAAIDTKILFMELANSWKPPGLWKSISRIPAL